MTISRTYFFLKKLAPCSNLKKDKAKLAFSSCFRRWVSAESRQLDEIAKELSKGKSFAALWGNGDYGRLGFGNLQSEWRPKTISPSAFDDQILREVACGGAHTLFLTENGDVYATGINDFGQLGVSDSNSYTSPLRVSGIPSRVVRISAGYHHSAAVTVDGELYIWGKNANGQLGLGKKAEKIIPVPVKVQCLDGVTIKIASLGFEHSIAVTDKGEALSWGDGESGRLGHGHELSILGFQKSSSEYTPRLIKELEGVKVKNVSAGMLHSACICENGSLYFFGERELGTWGFGKAKMATTPSTVYPLPLSDEVACGGYHTCVITSNLYGGDLYAWGSNENGCLGIGCTEVIYSPERVQGPFLKQPVTQVSCGWKHTAAISGGDIYTWGWGGSNGTFKEDGHSPGGQLGHGDDVDYIEPALLDFYKNVKALQVSCGFNHTAALFEYKPV
ncbi:ultraviolet-B receptor UVR8 isoform X2 [Primulina huaijiensis]|uniref:ultraviolet-B receptor UVR8 isoform X2 n=1 Tax=Primulina huaijiensis TaxID=1492673 RepID=UPI003CC743A3